MVVSYNIEGETYLIKFTNIEEDNPIEALIMIFS